jgi:hypothetical protein
MENIETQESILSPDLANERVLAYVKSVALTEEELVNISGGANTMMTHRRNVKGTGDRSSPDVFYDEVLDW